LSFVLLECCVLFCAIWLFLYVVSFSSTTATW
jgi:hypothetical protein